MPLRTQRSDINPSRDLRYVLNTSPQARYSKLDICLRQAICFNILAARRAMLKRGIYIISLPTLRKVISHWNKATIYRVCVSKHIANKMCICAHKCSACQEKYQNLKRIKAPFYTREPLSIAFKCLTPNWNLLNLS